MAAQHYVRQLGAARLHRGHLRLNDVNSVAYLAETLDAIINGHPQIQIEELMPWRFRKTSSPNP
ncbi:transposase domain-containing protein [Mesorhizobium sp. ISC25]|uniref:transposase domain-containing protein n=1 Tax=Mesorhizobium sp. ISC25 TaxID=3077335 RepID=UPI0035DF9DC2